MVMLNHVRGYATLFRVSEFLKMVFCLEGNFRDKCGLGVVLSSFFHASLSQCHLMEYYSVNQV